MCIYTCVCVCVRVCVCVYVDKHLGHPWTLPMLALYNEYPYTFSSTHPLALPQIASLLPPFPLPHAPQTLHSLSQEHDDSHSQTREGPLHNSSNGGGGGNVADSNPSDGLRSTPVRGLHNITSLFRCVWHTVVCGVWCVVCVYVCSG